MNLAMLDEALAGVETCGLQDFMNKLAAPLAEGMRLGSFKSLAEGWFPGAEGARRLPTALKCALSRRVEGWQVRPTVGRCQWKRRSLRSGPW